MKLLPLSEMPVPPPIGTVILPNPSPYPDGPIVFVNTPWGALAALGADACGY